MNPLFLLRSFLTASGAAVLIVAAGLIMLVVYLGYHIGLTGMLKLLVILGIIVVALVIQGIIVLRRKKQADNVEKSLIQEADASVAAAGGDRKRAREEARQELLAAIDALKRTRLAGGQSGETALAMLPWFLVLGGENSGKSGLIRHSGLRMPGIGDAEMRGIASSSDCEWWFTDQAILLESSARFADLDDPNTADSWRLFLDLLDRQRPAPALNGVVVTVSMEDLIAGDPAELENRARTIRSRLDTLAQRLKQTCPVYLMLSKCDLVHGFTEYFGDLDGAARHQIWGATISAALMNQPEPQQVFAQEFELLYRALCRRRDRRLVAQDSQPGQTSQAGQAETYLFPLEIRALLERLRDFVRVVAAPDPSAETLPLRGIYLSSAESIGQPQQVVLTEVSRVIGLPSQDGVAPHVPGAPQPVARGPAKPFFLKGFFLNVLIPDYGIAQPSFEAARRRSLIRRGLQMAGLAAIGLVAVLVIVSFVRNLNLVNRTLEIAQDARGVSLRSETLAELEDGLEDLERLRQQLERLDDAGGIAAISQLGLYRGAALNTRARDIYIDRLTTVLLEPSRKRLERTLQREYPTTPEAYAAFYDRYRAYRMLSEPTHGDPDLIAAQVRYAWAEDAVGRAPSENFRVLVNDHVAFAWDHRDDLRARMSYLPAVNASLVVRANELIKNFWRPELFYDLMIVAVDSIALPFTLDQVGGAAGLLVTDARVLAETGQAARVSGAYTVAAWQDLVRARIFGSDQQLREDWLLKEAFADQPTDIRSWLLDRYARDYAAAWAAFLAQVDVVPQPGVQPAARRLWELTREDSPFVRLLREAAYNLALHEATEKSQWDQVGPVLKIEDEFASLHDFLNKGDDGKPVDKYLETLANLTTALEGLLEASDVPANVADFTRAAFAAQGSGESPLGKTIFFGRLFVNRRGGAGDPAADSALETVLRRPGESAWRAALTETARHLDEAWDERIYRTFMAKLQGKYPLASGTQDEAAVTDFGEFFGPQGVLTRFVNTELGSYLEPDLETKAIYGYGLELASEALAALGKGAEIRRALFAGASELPAITFTLQPRQSETVSGSAPAVKQTILDVGSTVLTYDMGRQQTVSFSWPDAQGSIIARVSTLTEGPGPMPVTAPRSAWGIFRLLDRARVEAQSEREFKVSWLLERRDVFAIRVHYVLRAASSTNPFAPGFFALRLPPRLSN